MSEIDAQKCFDVALDLVKEAGKVVREAIKKKKNIETKSSAVDLVTESDKAVEKMLISGLSEAFPDHKFIGEESVSAGEKCILTDEPTWIIDPIDGTMNFVHSFPYTCISVGLWVKKAALVGVVYNPVLEQMFTAIKGQGAFLNGEKISVSGETELGQALVFSEIGTSLDPEKVNTVLTNITNLMPKVHGMTENVKIERVTLPVELGEGPHWSGAEGALYYVDIFNQNVHRYRPASNTHSKMHIEGGPVTLVVPLMGRRNKFVVSVGRDLAVVTWDDPSKDCVVTKYTTIASVDQKRAGNRFNDGKCDDLGRLWAGTMGNTDVPENPRPDLGSLFLLGHDSSVALMQEKVSISNGLAWSADHKTFYFIDTAAYKVEAFDCDFENAKISNRRTLYDYREQGLYPHFPDGMTIDTDGLLWVASFGTGKIHCINPNTCRVEREVQLPTHNPTSVCWGGPDLDQLFVTTTTKNITQEQLIGQPDAGAVFRITGLGARGRPARDCEVMI